MLGTSSRAFPHKWAVMFLIAVGFWNFLGAGVFGFLINLPIVSYYEIGTQFTANHGHGALMGVYGMLAMGFLVFVARYFIPQDRASNLGDGDFLLESEHRLGLHDLRQPGPGRLPPVPGQPGKRLLARPQPGILTPSRWSAPSNGPACPATSSSSSAASSPSSIWPCGPSIGATARPPWAPKKPPLNSSSGPQRVPNKPVPAGAARAACRLLTR